MLILIVAVLPGSMYVWAFERQASSYGVTLADRTLRFVAMSLIMHLILGWPEYVLYRAALAGHTFAGGQFAAIWGMALLDIAGPLALGTVLGGLYATRTSRSGWTRLRRRLSPEWEQRVLRLFLGRTPAPRAWDYLFGDRPTAYLRVRTVDGSWIAGLFANNSYAGGFPNQPDLLLEEAWAMNPIDGTLTDQGLGYPVYVASDQIAWIEVIKVGESVEEGPSNE